ncbi:MAG: type II secretion system F family protein [Gammaproteobacteria bacterium]|nr:MAG: type II secretion system F family protein [Gammaproteobacteria bacterium]
MAEEAIFVWEGTDRRGQRIKGEAPARTPLELRVKLRREGITPLKVRKKLTLFQRKKRITSKDITYFTRQLATMLSAGIPVVQALDIIGKGQENPSMQELILHIRNDVESGAPLSEALAKHPLYFEELYVNLVRAGEQAGALEDILAKIAAYKERTESIKGKVKKAMFYPTAVLLVAFAVTTIIMIFVIPQFEALFQSFGADLPVFTRFVIRLSKFFQTWWWAVFLGIGALAYAFFYAKRKSPRFAHAIDRLVLKIPIVGVILTKAAIARYARTLATLFGAGVPLVDALESVAGATGNAVYAEAVMRIREDVATGQQLQLAMRKTNLFPESVVQMVAIGEASGALEHMLNKIADFYEEEVSNMVDAMSSLLEPIVIVILGIIVGGLVVAMYLPIFKLAAVI